MAEKKSYYAILTADVRYCKEVSANAKLLYAEVTALCNEKGFCWASNSYFAELYGVSKGTVSRWFTELTRQGFITLQLIRNENKEVVERRVYLSNIKNDYTPILKNENTPIHKNEYYNTTDINNKVRDDESSLLKTKKEVKHKYGEYKNILLTDQELEKLKEQFDDWQEKIENISEGVAMKGYKYKSHYLAILKWAKNENKKATEKKSSWKEKEDALLGDWG